MFIGASLDGVDGSAAGGASMPDERTRERVLRDVLELGPVTAGELAERLGLTPAAVRRHLDALQALGSIEVADHATPGRRGRGRPARAYVATAAAHAGTAGEYPDVASAALNYLVERLGPAALADVARRRADALEARYAPVVRAAGADPLARAQALVDALAADGFAASTRPLLPVVPGVQVCQGHCPVHEVAEQFPEFCQAETDAFARLLGVHVQRLSTLADGAHACTTFIPAAAGRDGPTGTRDDPGPPRPDHDPSDKTHPHERTPR